MSCNMSIYLSRRCEHCLCPYSRESRSFVALALAVGNPPAIRLFSGCRMFQNACYLLLYLQPSHELSPMLESKYGKSVDATNCQLLSNILAPERYRRACDITSLLVLLQSTMWCWCRILATSTKSRMPPLEKWAIGMPPHMYVETCHIRCKLQLAAYADQLQPCSSVQVAQGLPKGKVGRVTPSIISPFPESAIFLCLLLATLHHISHD